MRQFQIKLSNGKVMGPMGPSELADLIQSGQASPDDFAKDFPDGEWLPIKEWPEFATLSADEEHDPTVIEEQKVEISEEIEATMIASSSDKERWQKKPVALDKTRIQRSMVPSTTSSGQMLTSPAEKNLAYQETLILNIPKEYVSTQVISAEPEEKKSNLKIIIMGIIAFILISDMDFGDKKVKTPPAPLSVTAQLPNYEDTRFSTDWSEKYYKAGIKAYTQDNVEGYIEAARLFRTAIERNKENSRAYGMLASSYLNLIESARNEAQFFDVVSQLIQQAKLRAENLPQTVIAEIELLILMNRPEAALDRLDRFSRVEGFSDEFNYYIALVLFNSGNYQKANSFLAKSAEVSAFSPKFHFLRGQVLEKMGSLEAAVEQYSRASELSLRVTINEKYPKGIFHARSRLSLAKLAVQIEGSKQIKNQLLLLKSVVENYKLVSPKDLAMAHYLRSQSFKVLKRFDLAYDSMTKALRLDQANLDYQLEQLFLKFKKEEQDAQKFSTKTGEATVGKARMYAYLIQGEEFFRKKQYAEAIEQYFKARREFPKSYLSFLRLGDAFYQQNKYLEARQNYEEAVELTRKVRLIAIKEKRTDFAYLRSLIELWFKYADVLIKTYEWDKAEKVISELRQIPGSQFSVDRLSGDLQRIKSNYDAALKFYERAMENAVIDPYIFVSYGQILLILKRYKDAPFYFAIARRFDPLNMSAIVGTAEAISNSDSIDTAISFLDKELARTGLRSELVTAVAQLEIRRGNIKRARELIDEAIKIDSKYAEPFKLKAQLSLRERATNPRALELAILSFRAYSDLNPTDAMGYLERYKIFMERRDFERAEKELSDIYDRAPKYPGLHFYRGQYYSVIGDRASSIREYGIELDNHPDNVSAMLALGKEYMEEGEKDKALNLFQDAGKQAPTLPEPWLLAGKTHLKDNQAEAALAMLQLALERDPNLAETYKVMGDAYRALENNEQMRESYRKYLQLAPNGPDSDVIRGRL